MSCWLRLSQRTLVKPVAINPGGRGKRFQLLELTNNGRTVLDSFNVTVPNGRGRGGIEHQWWCHAISEWLGERGAQCVIESESAGARVAIATETAGVKRVAIEVETAGELFDPGVGINTA